MDLILAHGLSFQDLYTLNGLACLDACFLNFLENEALGEDLGKAVKRARDPRQVLDAPQENQLILTLAPYVEAFLATLFGIRSAVEALQEAQHHPAALFRCKRLFVQRQAALAFPREVAALDPSSQHLLATQVADDLGIAPENLENEDHELAIAQAWMAWLEQPEAFGEQLERARRYGAWRAHHHPGDGVLFRLQQRVDPQTLVPCQRRPDGSLETTLPLARREGLSLTTPPPTSRQALDQSHRCIVCHPQGKDFCRKGFQKIPEQIEQNALGVSLQGCPLNQKISEMHALRKQGYLLGALAVVMVDNPMVPATGYRICNDCKLSCIFQKQEAVDTPLVETQILEAVLTLPWGVEIYSLLTRWNPLKFKDWLPQPPSGYTVLVAGMGPAGFTLAHALLQQGHRVLGVDALKKEDLPPAWVGETFQGTEGEPVGFYPILSKETLWEPLENRLSKGFGGVADYGITARWDKNFLTLIRLVLERRAAFDFQGDVFFGSTLTLEQALTRADHVALCLGAGKPTLPLLGATFPKGVFAAADFLMALHVTNVAHPRTLASFQLQLPLVVVGGGLTAIDAATEALAYYPVQVEAFLQAYEQACQTRGEAAVEGTWSPEEQALATMFIQQARALREEKAQAFLENRPPRVVEWLQAWGGVTVLYRRALQEAPSYRLNADEVAHALQQGLFFREGKEPLAFETDADGQLQGLRLDAQRSDQLPCRTVLMATGAQAMEVEGGVDDPRVSLVGDLDPAYRGSVVKAMASAKAAAGRIDQVLRKATPVYVPGSAYDPFQTHAFVETLTPLSPGADVWEVTLKAPQVARQFQPGHFFRVQRFQESIPPGSLPLGTLQSGNLIPKPLALTGISADPHAGTLTVVVSAQGLHPQFFLRQLKPGDRVSLMGPAGTPAVIPSNKIILFIGWDLCNVFFLPVARAMQAAGNRLYTLAGAASWSRFFKRQELEACYERVVWCGPEKRADKGAYKGAYNGLPPFAVRPQDAWQGGSPIDFLQGLSQGTPQVALQDTLQDTSLIPLETVDVIWMMASPGMLASLQTVLNTDLASRLKPSCERIATLNAPMQCMMKGVCGQCACVKQLPDQPQAVVFLCETQDQPLDAIHLTGLQHRLRQQPLTEKLLQLSLF
jgi:NADPH-dependent glutamate synthase beta subunit-like oxidoreductase